ncbi:MAG: MBL fold metallo-hydrolase [Mycobacteriales bacterium]
MRARVWGCRGSIAAPGRQTVRYGGNTSCVELELDDGSVAVLDAGTGMRELGRKLLSDGVRCVHVMLSHLHLDHLQGLAFFAPLYQRDVELHLWGPPSPLRSLSERVGLYMSDPLFPVSLHDVPCTLVVHDAPLDGAALGDGHLYAAPIAHNGPTVGYRIEAGGRALAYLPDHEPALGVAELRAAEVAWISGHDLASGVDLLLHDAQYSEAEYPDHIGWGHSSIDHVVQFATLADVDQLVLFHHDPGHSDDDLEQLHARAAELWGARPNPPVLAYDGMELELPAAPLAGANVAATNAPAAV